MSSNKTSASIMIWLLIFLFSLMLLSCRKDKQDEKQEPVISVNENTVSIENKSVRLSDNKLDKNMNFNNFKKITYNLDPSMLDITGDKLFLKLSRANNEILFLGEINRYQLFSTNFHLPLIDSYFHYETFTSNKNDSTNFGVVSL